jgi:hypothetical protein
MHKPMCNGMSRFCCKCLGVSVSLWIAMGKMWINLFDCFFYTPLSTVSGSRLLAVIITLMHWFSTTLSTYSQFWRDFNIIFF